MIRVVLPAHLQALAQVGAESDWRVAESKSIKDEAAKRGIDLKFSDAQGKQENQFKAIRSFIAQGVDASGKHLQGVRPEGR